MECPTPCEHCGEIFDLDDGYGSEKWHPNITICEDCYRKEEEEIEEDDRWEDINNELEDALHGLFGDKDTKEKISSENKESIKKLAKLFS